MKKGKSVNNNINNHNYNKKSSITKNKRQENQER